MIAAINGCEAGWVVAIGDGWPCREAPRLRLFFDFSAVLAATAYCGQGVVAMPVGLPAGHFRRTCDELAKHKLGEAGDQAYFAPPRPALAAHTLAEFVRLHRELTGYEPEPAVWGLLPKLRQVDETITPTLQEQLREFQPELTWERLAGHILPPRQSAEGQHWRLLTLQRHVAEMKRHPEWLAQLGGSVTLDILLDTLVGLAVAQAIAANPLYSGHLPESDAPVDERGLRMEVWY